MSRRFEYASFLTPVAEKSRVEHLQKGNREIHEYDVFAGIPDARQMGPRDSEAS